MQLDAREREAQALLDGAQQAMDLLQQHQRLVLGRLVPGWHTWPEVKRSAEAALAEVSAKRRVLDEHWAPTSPHADWPTSAPSDQCPTCNVAFPCRTLRLLAQPYAGRAGWREEWQA